MLGVDMEGSRRLSDVGRFVDEEAVEEFAIRDFLFVEEVDVGAFSFFFPFGVAFSFSFCFALCCSWRVGFPLDFSCSFFSLFFACFTDFF